MASSGSSGSSRPFSPLHHTPSSSPLHHTQPRVVDTRITRIRPLIPPACLLEELPADHSILQRISDTRAAMSRILHKEDDRLLVVIGPCSIHEPEGALLYAQRLKAEAVRHEKELLVAMRVYFEKPRTTIGYKGLVNDPRCDGTFAINEGLRVGRQVMLDICRLHLPLAVETLDTITPQYFSDLFCWSAIGARTTESQVHRELASGLSAVVGFKNTTGGSAKIAVDALIAAKSPHCFLSVTSQGIAAIVETTGNSDCHLILRGGDDGPNYSAAHVEQAALLMKKAELTPMIMIDCSHGNSQKSYKNQSKVVASVCEQVAANSTDLIGVMIESNLVEGNQKLVVGPGARDKLIIGQSVTDECIGWDESVLLLQQLSDAVVARRAAASKKTTS